MDGRGQQQDIAAEGGIKYGGHIIRQNAGGMLPVHLTAAAGAAGLNVQIKE